MYAICEEMEKICIKLARNLNKKVFRRGNAFHNGDNRFSWSYRTSKYNSYNRVITWGIVLSMPFIVVTYANIYIYVNKRRIHESCEYAFTSCTVFVCLGSQRYVIETFSNATIKIKVVAFAGSCYPTTVSERF